MGDPVAVAAEAQILLQAQPGRRYFRHRPESQLRQIGEPELGSIAGAHQKKRVAGHDFAKADERRAWVLVAGLHHPHWPAP
jgi:hypothetical protein